MSVRNYPLGKTLWGSVCAPSPYRLSSSPPSPRFLYPHPPEADVPASALRADGSEARGIRAGGLIGLSSYGLKWSRTNFFIVMSNMLYL